MGQTSRVRPARLFPRTLSRPHASPPHYRTHQRRLVSAGRTGARLHGRKEAQKVVATATGSPFLPVARRCGSKKKTRMTPNTQYTRCSCYRNRFAVPGSLASGSMTTSSSRIETPLSSTSSRLVPPSSLHTNYRFPTPRRRRLGSVCRTCPFAPSPSVTSTLPQPCVQQRAEPLRPVHHHRHPIRTMTQCYQTATTPPLCISYFDSFLSQRDPPLPSTSTIVQIPHNNP